MFFMSTTLENFFYFYVKISTKKPKFVMSTTLEAINISNRHFAPQTNNQLLTPTSKLQESAADENFATFRIRPMVSPAIIIVAQVIHGGRISPREKMQIYV